MFKCQVTRKNSMPGEKPKKVVTKTRTREYFKMDSRTGLPVKIGEGWEIVEEKMVLESVAKELKNE